MDSIENNIGMFLKGYGGEIDIEKLYSYMSQIMNAKNGHIHVMNLLNEGMLIIDGTTIKMTDRFKALL